MQNHTLPGVNALERAIFSMEAAAPYCEAHGSPIIADWLRSSAAELIAIIDAPPAKAGSHPNQERPQ